MRTASGLIRRLAPRPESGSERWNIAAPRRTLRWSGSLIGVRSRFASDVARETPTGTCSERDDDTSNRTRSRSSRRPCPRRSAPRRRRADTAPRPTEPSATPCHILAFRVLPLLSMDPPEGTGSLKVWSNVTCVWSTDSAPVYRFEASVSHERGPRVHPDRVRRRPGAPTLR